MFKFAGRLVTACRSEISNLKSPIIALLALALVAATADAAAAASPPNIVLIMADDMGYSDLGCYGSEIPTPNLDRLAAGGLRFTQFYNAARCCPTRASLMTGLYPHQAGVGHMMADHGLPGYRGDLAPTCVTIAEVLKTASYATYMSGKWHVTRYEGVLDGNAALKSQHDWPRQRGFDAFFGLIHGGGSYFNPILALDNDPYKIESDDFYLTDAISDRAVGYVSEHATKSPDQPFFLYVAYTAPHWPLHAPAEDVARNKGKYDGGWDALRDKRYRKMIDLGIVNPAWKLSPRDPVVPAWPDAPDKAWQARRMEVYAAQVEVLDRGVGRIVEKLRAAGMLDNTLIMFLADNGGCAEELKGGGGAKLSRPDTTRDGKPMRRGNDPAVMPGPDDTLQSYGHQWANLSDTPFRLYKHWTHEGGISTPFIAHWPKVIKPSGLTPQVGHIVDVMATCVELAGAKYPAERNGQAVTPLEGKSLRPILEGRERTGHEALFWEHEGNRAVRQGSWKLVSRHPGAWELYDMQADRTELNDLADQHPDKVKELTQLYEAWAKRCNVVEWSRLPRKTRP